MKQCLMTSQILKFVNFTKTKKIYISRYLEKERNIIFFQIKTLHIKGYFIAKNSFVVEVTFNTRSRELNLKNTL